MSTAELCEADIDGSGPLPRPVRLDLHPPASREPGVGFTQFSLIPNQTAGPVLEHRTGHDTKEIPLPMPSILYLVESGSMYAGPEGEARALTAPTLLSDPECLVDPTGEQGHVCVNRSGEPIRRYQACWTHARRQILNHDSYWTGGDAA